MRRILTMVLALAMVLTMAVGVFAAETGTEAALVLDVTQKKTSAEVKVSLQNCEGVTNGRFCVAFDADVLTLAQVQTTDAYAMHSVNDETAGKVYFAWVGSELTADKTLMVTLTFEAAEELTGSLTYSVTADGIYVGQDDAKVAGDSVTVDASAAVDTTALEQAVAAAEALKAEDYTEKSFAKVSDALAAAIIVLADSNATQSQVDAAAAALNDAMAALVKAGQLDYSELEKVIAAASKLKKEAYTKESFAVLEKALAHAKAVMEKDSVTQPQIDVAAKDLQKAIDGLESPKTGDETPVGGLIALLVLSAAGIVVLVVLLRKGKGKQVCRCISLILVTAMALSFLPADAFAVDVDLSGTIRDALGNAVGKVEEITGIDIDLKRDQGLTTQFQPYKADDMVRVIVELEGESLLERGYTPNQIAAFGSSVSTEVRKLEKLQNAMTDKIAALVEKSGLLPADENAGEARYNFTVALNGIAMTVPYGTLEQIRKLDGVKGAYVVSQYTAAQTESAATPSMYATAEGFGSAQTWNDLGYTGQGMKIAIVDTGLDLDHPSFAAAPAGASLKMEDIEHVLTELNAYYLYAEKSAVSLTAEDLYRSEKVPYGFNYVDCNLEVTHDFDDVGDHGTHVAGIAAANRLEGTPVVGVAPDAQIVVMKVFGEDGGAYADDLLASIEDSILLGVDVINMSLGSPAGYTEDSVLVNEVYGRILKTDMILAIAAGNTNSAASGNALGTNLNYTSDPDNGLVNSPSTYLAATSVASLENATMMMPYFTVGDNKIAYVDVTYKFAGLSGAETEYVMVPGYGRADDYAGLDVAGKVAVVSRGGGDDVTFVVKQENAYKNGAIGLVVYNNVEGDLVSMYDQGLLPNVFISKKDGAIMKEAAGEDGEGIMKIMPYGVETPLPSPVAGLMSDFSCWGVTPDLQLSPDVTAPGGNIYSCYTDGQYGTMSGTSMACPHIAGMSALVLQYLHEQYPDMTDEQYHTVAEALVMCTAEPIYDPDGILYSPRKQGAGSANVYSAVTSPVFLTSLQSATGELTPKASMGDDPERTGVYTFRFDMNNLTATAQTYLLEGLTLTEQHIEYEGKEYMGEIGRNLTADVIFELLDVSANLEYDANCDSKTDMDDVQYMLDVANGLKQLKESLHGQMDMNNDGVLNTVDAQMLYELLLSGYEPKTEVVVPANGSVTINVTVKLSDEDMAYMEAHYPNGIYVDGFVRAYAQSEGGVDLSLPFMGFYGDWHDAPMFDTGWYYEDEETVEFNRYFNVLFATLSADGSAAGGLGMNPYLPDDVYIPEHNVLSPNGDYYYDYVNEIYISMMRSAELLDFTWTNEEGEELYYEWYAYARKSYYWAAYGMCMPVVYTDGGCEPYTFYDEKGNLMVKDLDKLTLTIRGYLDDGDLDDVPVDEQGNPVPDAADADEVIQIPVVIDLSAPKMDIHSVKYSTENGRNYVTFTVEDNYDIATVIAMTNGGGAYEYVPVNEKVAGVDGEKATVTLDITDYDSTFQIMIGDYGCNETFYELSNVGNSGLSEDRFYGFRRYSTIVSGDAIYTVDELNGWYSFETADEMLMHTSQATSGEATVFAAEYVDGFIFGAQAGPDGYNTLFVSPAGSWDRIQLGTNRAMYKTAYEWPGRTDCTYFPLQMIALDMTYDYTTDTMYMLANALEYDIYFPEGEDNILLELDIHTGDVKVLGIIEAAEGEDFLALTLACDNSGTLYAVNYKNGKLYTVDKTPSETTPQYGYGTYQAHCVSTGETKFWPAAYTQSMTVDHATDKLYWAGYQGKTGTACFIELDKTNGEIISMTYTADNAEMVGLFKPYDTDETADIIPDVALSGIELSDSQLYLNVGQTGTLTANPLPYNAPMGEVTWHSEDESVAIVTEHGIVEAKGIGVTKVIATYGDLTAECTVNVSNVSGTLFAYSSGNWLLMDAGMPHQAALIADAMELEGDVVAAAYRDGFFYTAALVTEYDENYDTVYKTNIYKLNASTLQGSLLGTYDGKITALSFNYADGFMYALAYEETFDARWNMTCRYNLLRMNLSTTETLKVTDLDAIFPCSDVLGVYTTGSGALAIDYEGNFYVNGENEDGENVLVRFNLSSNDAITNITTYAGFSDCNYGGNAMVWSQRNGGLLHIGGTELEWVDVSDMENVTVAGLGEIRGAANTVLALAIPLSAEPDVPLVAPESITLADSYTVPAGETIRVIPTLHPWNAGGEFTYEIADENIAVVDEHGVVTGRNIGQTTITVTAVGTDVSATATIIVEKNPGYLYGFFQSDLVDMLPMELWCKMPISNPNAFTDMTRDYDLTIYAAAYYGGTVYAVGQHNVDGKYYMIRVSPSNFAYEIVCEADILVRDMAFDYTTGTMYVVGSTETVKGGLYQMDLDTMELTFLGDNADGAALVALACDAAGLLYAADDQGNVYTVNKKTVALTATGMTGIASQYLQSMAYDFANDAIYWANGGTLWQLDPANKQLISVGSNGCVISGMFSVPQSEVSMPESAKPSGVVMKEKDTVAVGETLQIDAVVLPVSVLSVDQTLIWSSSDETVATVDENGVITGVSAGQVYITAMDSQGNSDTILITVTQEHRYFYGYDEMSHSWVSFDKDGVVVNTWEDAEGLSPIVAAQYIDGVLYAYDQDGYFYSVDTETFQRTKLGNGIHGQVTSLEAWDNTHNGNVYFVDGVPYRMIDLTYGTENGETKLYGVMMAYHISDWRDSFSYKVVELDMATGEILSIFAEDALVDQEMSLRPTNLLYRDGLLYTINGYITGLVTVIDPAAGSVHGLCIMPKYWGDFNGGRSLIEDPLTGETYAIRDMRTEYIGTPGYTGQFATSVLCTMDLGIGRCEELATVGSNLRLVGLFIQ